MQVLLGFLISDGRPLELQELLFSEGPNCLLDCLAVEDEVDCLFAGKSLSYFPLPQSPSDIRKVRVILQGE